MRNIVPYTKEIKFDSKIAEISSISLEHELNILDTEINGNFIISGEYKTHEISVNKEEFIHKLPFSMEVTDAIIKDSISFEITDFSYEIVEPDILKVDIEFEVKAEEKEIELEDIEKASKNEKQAMEEFREEIADLFSSEDINLQQEESNNEQRLDQNSEEIIVSSASEKETEYVTYNIHIVTSTDTLESICTSYNIDLDYLKQYNNLDSINVGDKIIIPVDE